MKVQLIRKYTQLTRTYCVDHPTIGKEYIVNIVTNETTGTPISISISVDGEEILDDDEIEEVLQKIEDYNNER